MRSTMNTTKVPKLISHPFLLLRLIVLIVLFVLNILILSFGAFNITASRTGGKFVNAGPSLAVLNSSVFLFLSMLLLGEHKYSHAIPPVSIVLAEVSWVSVMTLLTFVSSVLSTRYGPATMCSSSPVNLAMCSSSILLLPVSWINFFTFFAYSATLLMVTILHAPLVPSIWHSNISEVPWFDFPASPVSRITRSSFSPDKSDPEDQTVYSDAFHSVPGIKDGGDLRTPPKAPWNTLPRGSLAISVTSFTPAWAKKHNVGLTRGLHNPFDRSTGEGSPDHQILDVPSHHVQRPARVFTKQDKKDDAVTIKTPDDDTNKTRSLQTLPGFSNLPRWSPVTTSGEINNQDQSTATLMLRNPPDRTSETTATTTTAVYFSPSGRKSVNSLFPRDVHEEDWNLPLTKPLFRDGGGEGWTTADASQDTVPTRSGRGRR